MSDSPSAITIARKTRAEVLREHAFKPGNSGGPGRPKGSRHKLGEKFVEDLITDWQENGIAVIQTVRKERPADYLKVVASVIPKEINHTVEEYDALSDDELRDAYLDVAARLASRAQDGARVGAARPDEGGAGALPH